jgi:hypothetical protein
MSKQKSEKQSITLKSSVEIENVMMLGEGQEDPLFAGLTPDDSKAYVTFDICKAFPNVIGPEMSGAYFGFHPQVLANSFRGLLHQQINLNHALKAYGSPRDRIVGCAVGVAFPEEPAGGWVIGSSPGEAPSLHVAAVLYKLSEGMTKMLGEHMSARRKWSTSIEVSAKMDNAGVYRRSTGELLGMKELTPELAEAVTRGEGGGVELGQIDGEQLAMAMGIRDGVVDFQGVAMTPTPAEKTAKITSLRAEGKTEEESPMIQIAASLAEPKLPFRVGQKVKWSKLAAKDAGIGKVEQIYVDGVHHIGGRGQVEATWDEPLLRIKPRSRAYEVMRSASKVRPI